MGKYEKEKKDGNTLKDIGWFALKTAGISAAVLGGTAVIVPALGFGARGVVAGSLAASYQSAVLGGTIASGSAFAVLQSVGAAGLAASTQAAVVGASAIASGVHTAIKKIKKKATDEEEEESDTEENVKKIAQDKKSNGELKKQCSSLHDVTDPVSLLPKWNDVKLSDDLLITKEILNRQKTVNKY